MSVTRDKTFLNYFYDLASDDKSVRLNAASLLVVHIKNSLKNNLPSDSEYALKRLVRGLASSRESARQGFATCLCELLVLPEMDLSVALDILDENTKLSGSLKGSEERDFMFGKLFCYLAVVRSGKVAKDVAASLKILDRILELHAKRGWIREVASESVLVFLSLASGDLIKAALAKVLPLINDIPMSELAAWQLMLLMGMQNIALKNASFRAEWSSSVSEYQLFSLERLDEVTATLCAATAGYPKIHRVWDFVLSFVFPMDADRVLRSHRLKSFTAAQEASLLTLSRFIDQHLISSSKEKRSVAMALATTLVRLSPAELLPVALSKSMVRSIFAARVTKKHTLYQLAGSVINDFVTSAVGDTQSRLALVSVLVQYGGANFDVNTGTRAVSTLLEGMEASEIASHIRLLCTVIGSAHTMSEKTASSEVVGEDDEEEAQNEDTQLVTATAAIESLTSIAKNGRIAGRADIVTQVVAVLVRLACFEQGVTKAYKAPLAVPASAKKAASSKKRKGSDLEADADSVAAAAAGLHAYPNVNTIECVRLVESVLSNESVADDLSELASVKLLALLADLGTQTVQQLDKPLPVSTKVEGDVTTEREADSTPSVLQVAWNTLSYISHASNGPALRGGVVESSEDVEEGEAATTPAEFIAHIESVVKTNKALVVSTTGSDATEQKAAVSRNRLLEALNALLTQAAFHALTSSEIDFQTVKDVAAIVPQLVTNKPIVVEAEGDDEEEGEADALLPLFEACMDLLSVPSEHSIKGLRDAIKRVWTSVCYIQGDDISLDVIDSVVAAVIGDDADDAGQDDAIEGRPEGGEDDGGDDSEVDDEEEEESDEEEEEVVADKKGKKQTPVVAPASTKKGKKAAVPVEEQEDIMLSEDQALDLLAENMDEADDEEFEASLEAMGLQHSMEHDDALAQMIALRKQNRKAGLLQARRRQMLIRSRAVDILEIVINRVELGDLLYPMYLPLLKCLGRCVASTLTQSLAEGKAYTHRLAAVLEQKLCKKRFHLVGDGDEGAESAIIEESTLLLEHITKQLVSSHTPLRQMAHVSLLSVARAIVSSDCEQAKTLLVEAVRPVFVTVCTKKNHRIPAKLVDDLLLNRFTDFFTPVLLPELIAQVASSTQTFTRSELCRILGTLLKKFNGMNAVAKEAVQSSLAAITGALSSAVENIARSASEQKPKKPDAKETTVPVVANSLSAKRFKPVLVAIKELLEFIKRNKLETVQQTAAPTPAKGKKATPASSSSAAPVALLASIQQLRTTLSQHHDEHSKSNSPVIVKLVQQIADMTASMQGGVAVASNNGNGKSNGKTAAPVKAAPVTVEIDGDDSAKIERQIEEQRAQKKREKNQSKRKKGDDEDEVYDNAEKAANLTVEGSNRKKQVVAAEETLYIPSQDKEVVDTKKTKKQKK